MLSFHTLFPNDRSSDNEKKKREKPVVRACKQGADQSCSLFLRVSGLRVKAQTRAYPLWAMIKSRNGKKYPPSVIVHRRKHKKRGEGLLPLLSKTLDFTRACGAQCAPLHGLMFSRNTASARRSVLSLIPLFQILFEKTLEEAFQGLAVAGYQSRHSSVTSSGTSCKPQSSAAFWMTSQSHSRSSVSISS